MQKKNIFIACLCLKQSSVEEPDQFYKFARFTNGLVPDSF
jgi:hypothetical protein